MVGSRYIRLTRDRTVQFTSTCSSFNTTELRTPCLVPLIQLQERIMSLITTRNTVIGTLVASFAFLAYSLPEGAPVETCVRARANEPNHGQARSQPLETTPYTFTASSAEYGPGSQITVTISGAPFKGFFLQGRDTDKDSWIGSWAQTPNTNTHPECSAVTHADPHVKQHATLIWNAPPNARGRVYFTGTILQNYATFWSNLVAQTKH